MQKTGTANFDREDELLWNAVEKHNPQPIASTSSALMQPSKQESDQNLQPNTSADPTCLSKKLDEDRGTLGKMLEFPYLFKEMSSNF